MAWGAAAVTLGAMIATPLAGRGGAVRRVLSPVVVSGLAATTSAAATRRWGGARTACAAGAIALGTGVVEAVGSRRGIPFGRYAYTDRLRPQVAGVPAVVPVAWWAMALPARETAVAALGPDATRAQRIVAGAAALTAWDLFLDPQMVAEGYWRWSRAGRYRGIPATNFLGWFVTGLAVMAALDVLLPPATPAPAPTASTSVVPDNATRHGGDRLADAATTASTSVVPDDETRRGGDRLADGGRRGRGSGDAALVGIYATMAVMETLGFAAFFRDRKVAWAGGAAMLPTAALATLRVLRERSRG